MHQSCRFLGRKDLKKFQYSLILGNKTPVNLICSFAVKKDPSIEEKRYSKNTIDVSQFSILRDEVNFGCSKCKDRWFSKLSKLFSEHDQDVLVLGHDL